MKNPLLIKIGGSGFLLDTKLLTLTEVVVSSTLLAVVLGVITVWGLDVVDAGVDAFVDAGVDAGVDEEALLLAPKVREQS